MDTQTPIDTAATRPHIATLLQRKQMKPKLVDIMAIKVEISEVHSTLNRPKTDHSMSPPLEKTGKRPRRQTMGASRLPQSTSSTNVSSKFRLPTPSALPRSVSFFTNFNRSASTKPAETNTQKPQATVSAIGVQRTRSRWQPRESMPDPTTRSSIPVQKRQPIVPIPQRGLLSQIQPLPSLLPQTTLATHHRDESIEDCNEVSSSKPTSYWLGRYMAVSDNLRNAALPDMQKGRSISPIPSFQIVRSVSTPPNTTERTFPTRTSSKALGCDHLHAMHDRDQRDKRVFALLKEYCLTDAAQHSLAVFVTAMADARAATGDDKVGMLRGIGKNLRTNSVASDKKGWLNGITGKKKGVREKV